MSYSALSSAVASDGLGDDFISTCPGQPSNEGHHGLASLMKTDNHYEILWLWEGLGCHPLQEMCTSHWP